MDKNLLRVLDANYNRAKEGLRVAEDIFRFVVENDGQRRAIRAIRHALTRIVGKAEILRAIAARDSRRDLGRAVDTLEVTRRDYRDILWANLQRAKESLRVMEECAKVTAPKTVSDLKKLRYQTYGVEKMVLARHGRGEPKNRRA